MYQSIEVGLYVLILVIIWFLNWRKRLKGDFDHSAVTGGNGVGFSTQTKPSYSKTKPLKHRVNHQRQSPPKQDNGCIRKATASIRPVKNSPSLSELSWRNSDCPPAPPPSPASVEEGSDEYVANLRVLQSLSVYNEEQVYTDPLPVAHNVSAEAKAQKIPLRKDEDHERRSSYCKNSVTSGELMLQIGEYNICQFFINGIEYHFCVSVESRSTFWHLPEEIRDACKQWYLECPRHKRKKSGLTEPPVVLEVVGSEEPPAFRTNVVTY